MLLMQSACSKNLHQPFNKKAWLAVKNTIAKPLVSAELQSAPHNTVEQNKTLLMGRKAPIFQGLIILSAEPSLYSISAVSGVTCWEVSLASEAPSPKPPSLSQAPFRSHSPMVGRQVTPTPSHRAGPVGALKGQQGLGAHLPPCFEANPPHIVHDGTLPGLPEKRRSTASVPAACSIHGYIFQSCLLFRAGDEWGAIYRKPDSVPGTETKATIETWFRQPRMYSSTFGRTSTSTSANSNERIYHWIKMDFISEA